MSDAKITIEGLKKYFPVKDGALLHRKTSYVKAVDDVSLTINKGEIMGLVGESGSGKTTLARLVLGLIAPTEGKVLIGDRDFARLGRKEKKALRKNIAVVFQDPVSNLNPRDTVEASIARPMIIHGVPKSEALSRAAEALGMVSMDERYLKSYPHQLSGGQLQRVAIARAIVMRPEIMVLDEPTSALDISVQAQVMNLLLDLQEELGLTYLMVTHDLNVIRYMSDRVAVMYLGQLMEYGVTDDVMLRPLHPYTMGLMAAAPVLHPSLRGTRKHIISGEPGSLIDTTAGCRLAPRCPFATGLCRSTPPPVRDAGGGHMVFCHYNIEEQDLPRR